MKFKKGGLFVSIAWVFIALLHGYSYGLGAGITMSLAALMIIYYQLEK